MIQPACAGNWGCSELPQISPAGPSAPNTHPKPPKRKPGRPKNGSSIEHPIEIDIKKKPRRVAAGKKNGHSKHPFPAPPQSSRGSSSSSSGKPFPVQRAQNPNPRQLLPGHQLQNPGGILPSNPQQRSQFVMGTTDAYYPRPTQLQTPRVVPSQPLEAAQLAQNYFSVGRPVSLQPTLVSRACPVPIIQQYPQDVSQDMSANFQQGPQCAPNTRGARPEQLNPSHPQQMFEPLWDPTPNRYSQAALGNTNASYRRFELRPGTNVLPSAGVNAGGHLAPSGDTNWLVNSEAEQQIVDGWLENWESSGLLSDTIERPLFKRCS